MNKVALSVDIEDWYHSSAVISSKFARYRTFEEFSNDYEFNIDRFIEPYNRIIRLFKKCQIKATFFVVADMAKRFPYIIEQIVENNHEVASHGLYHYPKYNPSLKKMNYSLAEFEDMAAESKHILESLSGLKVVGYRAPGAYICGEMIDSLEKSGFKYDSSVSVNSFYNKTDGTTDGISTSPYYPAKGKLSDSKEKRNIVEFPWSYFNLLGIKLPTAGGPFLRFFGKTYISKGIKQSLDRGDTMFYFHAIDISNSKFPSLGKKRPFYFAIKGRLIEERIYSILNMFKGRLCRFVDVLQKYQDMK